MTPTSVTNPMSDRRAALSLREVAESLGVSLGFIRCEVRRGRLRPARLGRRVVVTREELSAYLARAQA